jgi:nitroimidazol reductase NimA-like FMN-containing flavoprotein (pyridoxamine 5'-phosphate oxidase superfamily)
VSAPGERIRIRRAADRADYDRATIEAILDAALVCQVAYVVDGEPRSVPTAIMRRGEHVYLHGNRQSAMIRALEAGALAAVSVTHVDGLVAARSGFHCSMNYRSVVLYGHAETVTGEEKEALLGAFVDKLIPGHGNAVREPTEQELAATTLVRIPIEEAVAKQRTGGPKDDPADAALDIWSGVIPLQPVPGEPIAGAESADLPVPAHIQGYGRKP